MDKWLILTNQNWILQTCDSFPLIVSHMYSEISLNHFVIEQCLWVVINLDPPIPELETYMWPVSHNLGYPNYCSNSKNYYVIIFQWQPWIIQIVIMIILGSHIPNINNEVVVCPTWVELSELSEHLSWFWGVTHVFSHVYYNSEKKKMTTRMKIFIITSVIYYWNKLLTSCGHTPQK